MKRGFSRSVITIALSSSRCRKNSNHHRLGRDQLLRIKCRVRLPCIYSGYISHNQTALSLEAETTRVHHLTRRQGIYGVGVGSDRAARLVLVSHARTVSLYNWTREECRLNGLSMISLFSASHMRMVMWAEPGQFEYDGGRVRSKRDPGCVRLMFC